MNPLADSLADSLADFVADFWRISGEEFPVLFACVFSIGIGRNSSPEIHPKFTLGFTTQFGLGPPWQQTHLEMHMVLGGVSDAFRGVT